MKVLREESPRIEKLQEKIRQKKIEQEERCGRSNQVVNEEKKKLKER